MIDPGQLRRVVIRPVLRTLGMEGQAAEDLLLGTAAQESRLRYLMQIGGPALGIFQIEPATHKDLYINWLFYRGETYTLVKAMAGAWPEPVTVMDGPKSIAMPDHESLIGNLFYATAVARLIYRRVKEPLPKAGDVQGYAAFWKAHYNTSLGKGTEEEFINNYRELVNQGE